MDPQSSRRQFLAASASALATASVLPRAHAKRAAPVIVGARQSIDPTSAARSFMLVALGEDGAEVVKLPLPFHLHGFAGHPKQPRLAALFEKQGPGGCVVDLVAGKIVAPLTPAADRLFYGHGAYSPDAALLYTTETVRSTMEGVIAVRDGRTYREIGHFPSHGAAPHDCHLIDDGKVMVVTNGGGTQEDGLPPPSVTWVDVKTQKLLDSFPIPSPRLNAGHVAVGSQGDVAVVSAPRRGLPSSERGGVTLRLHDGAAHTLSEPAAIVARMVGEVLSVAIHEPTLTAAATNPDGNLLTFWQMKQGSLRSSVKLDRPRGVLVTPDGKWFAVTHGQAEPRVSFYSAFTLAPGKRPDFSSAGLSGSHIYNWEV